MKDLPYLRRPGPLFIILGSFFVVTIPLTTIRILPNSAFPDFREVIFYLFAFQAVGLGMSHFVVTGALYLRHENLEYFASSRLRKFIYFGVPIGIFCLYGLIGATRFPATYPALAAGFFGFCRIFDFTHVGRQSFGILQITKSAHGASLPAWTRPAENWLFLGLAGLQMATFLVGGKFKSELPLMRAGAMAAAALFLTISYAYLRGLAQADQRRTLAIPLIYLTLQTISSALGVYNSNLYIIALTMHYVEYQVIMAPRCFSPSRDERYRVDRVMHWLTRHKLIFYGAVLAIAVFVKLGPPNLTPLTRGVPGEFSLRFLLNFCAGLTLVHFFVDAFVWKFSQPFYRRTLSPLYRGSV